MELGGRGGEGRGKVGGGLMNKTDFHDLTNADVTKLFPLRCSSYEHVVSFQKQNQSVEYLMVFFYKYTIFILYKCIKCIERKTQ